MYISVWLADPEGESMGVVTYMHVPPLWKIKMKNKAKHMIRKPPREKQLYKLHIR